MCLPQEVKVKVSKKLLTYPHESESEKNPPVQVKVKVMKKKKPVQVKVKVIKKTCPSDCPEKSVTFHLGFLLLKVSSHLSLMLEKHICKLKRKYICRI